MLAAFDFPETDISCEARFLTTQPGQALGMLNSDWMQQQSAALYRRVVREAGTDITAQATRALQLTSGHVPAPADVKELVALVRAPTNQTLTSPTSAPAKPCAWPR